MKNSKNLVKLMYIIGGLLCAIGIGLMAADLFGSSGEIPGDASSLGSLPPIVITDLDSVSSDESSDTSLSSVVEDDSGVSDDSVVSEAEVSESEAE